MRERVKRKNRWRERKRGGGREGRERDVLESVK